MAPKKTTKKKTAAPKKSAPKKTNTVVAKGELAVMENEDKDILAGICQDLDNSDIGQFYRARACVALVLLKERCPHGLYENTTAEAMPNRSARTLRRYFSEGKTFLDATNLKAGDAYAQLKGFDPVTALTQGSDGRLLIGSGDGGAQAKEIPQAVEALANKINDKIDERTNANGDPSPKKKKLTRAQKREAAVSDLMGAVTKVNVALGGAWILVDTETLDTVQASLTVAVATIKEELKTRG